MVEPVMEKIIGVRLMKPEYDWLLKQAKISLRSVSAQVRYLVCTAMAAQDAQNKQGKRKTKEP